MKNNEYLRRIDKREYLTEREHREYLEQLEKDLEVLEILKPMLKIAKGGTWWYLDTKHCFFDNQETIDKIKEWLKNEK